MKKWPDTLRELIKKSGKSQEKVGAEIGLSQGLISQYLGETKHPRMGTLKKIANYFNVTTNYLLSHNNGESEFKIFTIPKTYNRIFPVLNFDQINDWLKNPTNIHAYRTESMLLSDKDIVSPESFFIEITGDALISQSELSESFFPGELALIDPKALPIPEKFVLVEIKGDKKIRKLTFDGQQKILASLNSKYQNIPINEDIKILGVVFGSYRKR